MGEKVKLWF